jgi:hypothetical protein
LNRESHGEEGKCQAKDRDSLQSREPPKQTKRDSDVEERDIQAKNWNNNVEEGDSQAKDRHSHAEERDS